MKKLLITIPFLFLAAACNKQQAQVQPVQNQQAPTSQPAQVQPQAQQPQSSQQQASSTVSTADWKTYSNSKFGFSFQYPATATLGESTNQKLCGDYFQPLGCLAVSVDFSDGSVLSYMHEADFNDVEVTKKGNFTIDGKDFAWTGDDTHIIIGNLGKDQKAEIEFFNNNGDQDYQIFLKILSTFKFTN